MTSGGVQGRRALLRFPRLGLPASGLEGLGFGALLADAVAGVPAPLVWS